MNLIIRYFYFAYFYFLDSSFPDFPQGLVILVQRQMFRAPDHRYDRAVPGKRSE